MFDKITYNPNSNTREPRFKLREAKFEGDVGDKIYRSRVVNAWNTLTGLVVQH